MCDLGRYLRWFIILWVLLLAMARPCRAQTGDPFQLINEGRALARGGNFPTALDKIEGAIVLANESGQKLAAAIALTNMAEILRLQRRTPEALDRYTEALQIYREIQHRNGIAATRGQIDKILAPLGLAGQGSVPSLSTGEIPQKARERLIEEAVGRVRDRVGVRDGQSEAPSRQDPGATQTEAREVGPVARVEKPEPASAERNAYKTYLDEVRKTITRTWQYPDRASRSRKSGKVEVRFTVFKDGRLESVRVVSSSGFTSLDGAAIRAVKAASPFKPIPQAIGLQRLSIRFTFNYILEEKR